MPQLADGFRAFLFGLTLAASVGPIALMIVNYGALVGARAAVLAAFGAALADGGYAILAFVSGQAVQPFLKTFSGGLHLWASVVLILFGLWMLRGALKTGSLSAAQGSVRRPLLSTWLLTVTNPLTIVAFLGFSAQVVAPGDVRQSLSLAVCVFLGSLLAQLTFALGGVAFSRLLLRLRIAVWSALGIMAFGGWGLWEALS